MQRLQEKRWSKVCQAAYQTQLYRDWINENSVTIFYVNGESSHVLARTLSDRYGICLRSGHHCAQPLHDALKIPPTMRISIGLYNNIAEIDRCIDALQEIVKNSTHVY